jgi:hypothetical protein
MKLARFHTLAYLGLFLLTICCLSGQACPIEKYGYDGTFSGTVAFSDTDIRTLSLNLSESYAGKVSGSAEMQDEEVKTGGTGNGDEALFNFEIIVELPNGKEDVWKWSADTSKVDNKIVMADGQVSELAGRMRYSYCSDDGVTCVVMYGDYDIVRE